MPAHRGPLGAGGRALQSVHAGGQYQTGIHAHGHAPGDRLSGGSGGPSRLRSLSTAGSAVLQAHANAAVAAAVGGAGQGGGVEGERPSGAAYERHSAG